MSPSKVQFDSLTHLLKHAFVVEEDKDKTLVLLHDGRLFVGMPTPDHRVLWEEQDFHET